MLYGCVRSGSTGRPTCVVLLDSVAAEGIAGRVFLSGGRGLAKTKALALASSRAALGGHDGRVGDSATVPRQDGMGALLVARRAALVLVGLLDLLGGRSLADTTD